MRKPDLDQVRKKSKSPLLKVEVTGKAPNRSYLFRVECAVCGHVWVANGYRLSQHGCDICARRARRKED